MDVRANSSFPRKPLNVSTCADKINKQILCRIKNKNHLSPEHHSMLLWKSLWTIGDASAENFAFARIKKSLIFGKNKKRGGGNTQTDNRQTLWRIDLTDLGED